MFFIVFGVLFTRGDTSKSDEQTGIFFILFYLSSYGSIHGFSSNMIFYSVSILNAASFVSTHLFFFHGSRFVLTHPKFGRILPG
jgi:hypothetical protein